MPNCAKGYRERALTALDALPRFSPLLDRLIANLNEQENSLREISRIVQSDSVIAGHVLQVANSAQYARRATVATIPRAVAIVGVNKLRNIALAMAFRRSLSSMKRPAGWSDRRFSTESVTCALICDALASRFPVPDPEAAFAAGLLHHLGILLIACTVPERYVALINTRDATGTMILDCERELIGVTHPELSAYVFHQWNLPASICYAAEYHHDPDLESPHLKPGEIGLSRVIACADEYIWGLRNPDMKPDSEPFSPLGIKLESAGFLEHVQAEVQTVSDYPFA